MIDATPAFPEQVNDMLAAFPGYSFAGVLLTHAHMGHYTGLVHLGTEAWDLQELPIFASPRMLAFLRANEPWAAILRDHLAPQELKPPEPVNLSEAVKIRPVSVPHRAEYSDTLAYWIESESGALFYCPDIDGWEGFPLEEVLGRADHALLDATFYSRDELPGRDLTRVPHPFVTETLQRTAGVKARIWLVHLNHSNPLHSEGPEREAVQAAGLRVAAEGQRWFFSEKR